MMVIILWANDFSIKISFHGQNGRVTDGSREPHARAGGQGRPRRAHSPRRGDSCSRVCERLPAPWRGIGFLPLLTQCHEPGPATGPPSRLISEPSGPWDRPCNGAVPGETGQIITTRWFVIWRPWWRAGVSFGAHRHGSFVASPLPPPLLSFPVLGAWARPLQRPRPLHHRPRVRGLDVLSPQREVTGRAPTPLPGWSFRQSIWNQVMYLKELESALDKVTDA